MLVAMGIHPDHEFAKHLVGLRRARRLHGEVAQRLTELMMKVHPLAVSVPEVGGVLGGRNDLINFSFDGRRVVFEVFGSASQVPQDLRLLEQSSAEVKVAVLLDEEADPTVSRAYFHKKPDPFGFLWVSHVLRPELEAFTLARLAELTDEGAVVRRVRRLLAHPAGSTIDRHLRTQLTQLEEALAKSLPATSTTPQKGLTGREAIALKVVAKVHRLGIPGEKLRSLYVWLERAIEYGVTLVSAGFQPFLVTDLDDYRGIWSAGDLADLVFLMGDAHRPKIVMELTEIIRAEMKARGFEARPQEFHFVHGYGEFVNLVPKDSRLRVVSPRTRHRAERSRIEQRPPNQAGRRRKRSSK
jgi:hypothetical protein